MVAIGLIVLITIIFFGVGSYLLSKIGLKEEISEITSLEHFIYSVGLGFIILSGIVFVLGLFGYLYQWCLWSILIVFGALTSRRIIALFKQIWHYLRQWSFFSYSLFEKILLLCIATCAIGYLLVALSPPTFGDGIHNLFASTRAYIRSHRIHMLPYYFSTRPRNIVLFYIVGYLLQGEILAQLFNWIMTFLSGMLIYTTTSRYVTGSSDPHKTREYALLAVAIFYTMPLVMMVSGNALSESGVVFYGFLVFCVLLHWWSSLRMKWLLLAGIFSGFCAGFKIIGLEVPLVIGLFIIFRGLKAWHSQRRLSTFTALCLSVFTFTMTSSVTGVPWYYLTYKWTGTFFYNGYENREQVFDWYLSTYSDTGSQEELYVTSEHQVLSSVSQPPTYSDAGSQEEVHPTSEPQVLSPASQPQKIQIPQPQKSGESRLKQYLLLLYSTRNWRASLLRFGPLKLAKYAWQMSTNRGHQGYGISPLYLAFVPLLLFFPPKGKKLYIFVWFSIIYFVVGVNLWGHYTRYLIPIFPVLSVLTVQVIQNIGTVHRKLESFSKFACLVTFLLYFPVVVHSGINHFPAAFGLIDREVYLNDHHPGSFAVAQYVNKNLPETTKLFLLGESRLFLFDRDYIDGTLNNIYFGLLMLYQDFENPDNAYRKLKLLGVTHVIMNIRESNNSGYYDGKNYIENFKHKYLEELYHDSDVFLYKIKRPM